MLPPAFLAAQARSDFRDVLNFIHGFVARSTDVALHLEASHGVEASKKLNYVHAGRPILVLWILSDRMRLELHDPVPTIQFPRLYESGQQFKKKGWRNYKFDPLSSPELADCLRLIEECIALHC
jgi:hypothetical protein